MRRPLDWSIRLADSRPNLFVPMIIFLVAEVIFFLKSSYTLAVFCLVVAAACNFWTWVQCRSIQKAINAKRDAFATRLSEPLDKLD